jgi:DNA-binding transcriptional LysR family regulator
MDIDLIKTFLEVSRTRHFGRAAENLYLTQSAVSARIRQLEELLGSPLFTRARHNIRLTSTGARFLKHAESILNSWNRACQEAALGQTDRPLLAVGGSFSLWDILLQDWIHRLHETIPELALQAEAHDQEVLVRRLLDGALDLAFLFEPPEMAELQIQEVATIELVLVSDRPRLAVREALGEGYVMVDWGTAFAIAHARYFPDIPPPALRMGLGRMALAFLLEHGGAAYLAYGMVASHLEAGRLHLVAQAPVIDRKVYAVTVSGHERRQLLERLLGLFSETFHSNAAPPKVAQAL